MPRPRTTQNYAGTAVGALIGMLPAGPVGAVVGGLLGSAANPADPLPLHAALAKFIADKGLQFGGFERLRWNSVRVVFGHGTNFVYVDAVAPPNRAEYPGVEALEDALYDVATRQIDEQVKRLGVR